MLRLFDGNSLLQIEMETCFLTDSGTPYYSEPEEIRFFETSTLPYNEEHECYLVDDVTYCLDQAKDWQEWRGDYEVEDDGREHCKEERLLNYVMRGDLGMSKKHFVFYGSLSPVSYVDYVNGAEWEYADSQEDENGRSYMIAFNLFRGFYAYVDDDILINNPSTECGKRDPGPIEKTGYSEEELIALSLTITSQFFRNARNNADDVESWDHYDTLLKAYTALKKKREGLI